MCVDSVELEMSEKTKQKKNRKYSNYLLKHVYNVFFMCIKLYWPYCLKWGAGLWAIFPNTPTLYLYHLLSFMCALIIIKGTVSCFQLVGMMDAQSCDVRWCLIGSQFG